MNNFVGLTKQVFSGIRAESIYTQLSASMQKEMDKPFQMPNNLYEFGIANQCMPFDDVRRIFAMYEQALRLKDNLIANLLEKNRQLEQEKQRLQQATQRIPLLEEHIKFLEEHPTTTNIYNAPHYQADKIEKHSDVEIGSMNVSQGGVGINYSKPVPTNATANMSEPIQRENDCVENRICCFIIKGAAYSRYYCDDIEFNERLRLATHDTAKNLVDYLIRHENMKILDFMGCKAKGIFAELETCFGKLKYQYQMFQRECSYRNWKVS